MIDFSKWRNIGSRIIKPVIKPYNPQHIKPFIKPILVGASHDNMGNPLKPTAPRKQLIPGKDYFYDPKNPTLK